MIWSSISSGTGHIHRLLCRASCIAKRPILLTVEHQSSASGPSSREQWSWKMWTSLYVFIFHRWRNCQQRLIIRSLRKENANRDYIHRKLQAQFINDAYSIRSVRRWCQFHRQGRRPHDDSRSGRAPIDLPTPKFCQHWREGHFTLHTYSLRS
jgi:hypothetical protein